MEPLTAVRREPDLWNTLCMVNRSGSNQTRFRAVLDDALVYHLRLGDACGSLAASGTSSALAVRDFDAGFRAYERWNTPAERVLIFRNAVAGHGGLMADGACYPLPQLSWGDKTASACRAPRPERARTRSVEQLVYLHLAFHFDAPGHSICQLFPALALALTHRMLHRPLAGRGTAAFLPAFLHTDQDVRVGWFREWVQLVGGRGMEARLLHGVVSANQVLVPMGTGNVRGAPLASTMRTTRQLIWRNLDDLTRRPAPIGGDAAIGPQVVLVTRHNQSRAIANVDVLVRALHGSLAAGELARGRLHRFEDTHSAIDQCALFRAADLVVAPHGAARANLLCARPGTAVVELHAPVWRPPGRSEAQPNMVFLHLAWQLDQPYYGVHVPGATYTGTMHVQTARVVHAIRTFASRGWLRAARRERRVGRDAR